MPALDGLRAVAILAVMLFHMNPSFAVAQNSLIDRIRGAMAMAGWMGVDLFFVLSGFLITGILLATRESKRYYRSFYMRRTLRIFPMYYLVLLLAFIVLRHILGKADVASLVVFFYNFRVVMLGHHLPLVYPYWSLAIEEQFYLVWPFTVLLLSMRSLRRVCLIGIVLSLCLRLFVMGHSTTFQSAYYLTFCRLDGLFAGALLAIWRRDHTSWSQVVRFAPKVAAGSCLLLALMLCWSGSALDSRTVAQAGWRHSSFAIVGPGTTLLAMAFGALVALCTQQGGLFRFFTWRPFRFIGKYSYSAYLLHTITVLPIVRVLAPRLQRGCAGPLLFFVCYCAFVALTFAVAWSTFQLVEKHFLRLKRHFPAVDPAGS